MEKDSTIQELFNIMDFYKENRRNKFESTNSDIINEWYKLINNKNQKYNLTYAFEPLNWEPWRLNIMHGPFFIGTINYEFLNWEISTAIDRCEDIGFEFLNDARLPKRVSDNTIIPSKEIRSEIMKCFSTIIKEEIKDEKNYWCDSYNGSSLSTNFKLRGNNDVDISSLFNENSFFSRMIDKFIDLSIEKIKQSDQKYYKNIIEIFEAIKTDNEM